MLSSPNSHLWAPWRLGYVQGLVRKHARGGPACFLCAARRGKDDRRTYVLERGRHAFCVLNKYPYNNGHLMVVPNRHTGDVEALEAEELSEVMALAKGYVGALRRCLKPHGFNLGINMGRPAGAGLDTHLHLHVVPRWHADTNFMPVLGGTKVISQALEDLYRSLRRARGLGR